MTVRVILLAIVTVVGAGIVFWQGLRFEAGAILAGGTFLIVARLIFGRPSDD